jgi:ankyrin repeat protein
MATLHTDEPLAVAVVEAIQTGDVPALKLALADNPGLAKVRLGDDQPSGMSRTLLHVATDWPGHFPNGPATVAALVQAGADVNARFRGPHNETPLHWAASSDDVAVLDALLTPAQTSRHPARSSAAAPRSTTPGHSASGGQRIGWSSAAHESTSRTPRHSG